MRIVFLHSNFPAQFVHLASMLARNPVNQVMFITAREEGSIPDVQKILYKIHREPKRETHPYLHGFENAVIQGQAVYRVLAGLKKKGFIPDVVYGHSGWGLPLFVKDIFPSAKMICLFEWYYRAHGSDADFDPASPLTVDDELCIRLKNASILTDLDSCDWGVSPTYWQHRQFPVEYTTKISIIHDGVDTQNTRPIPGAKLILPELKLDLSEAKEIVTYVARGMEPYRGFPQFMEAVRIITERRPQCHVVIVGADRVAYGRSLPQGKTYKQQSLENLSLDISRIHFTGLLNRSNYLKVLQASTVHVYLTRPFVLSWSMLEAMSAGCLVVASDTDPVKEVVTDGLNGLLTDFFSPEKIAEKVSEALDNQDQLRIIRQRARTTILDRYSLPKMLGMQLRMLEWLLGQ